MRRSCLVYVFAALGCVTAFPGEAGAQVPPIENISGKALASSANKVSMGQHSILAYADRNGQHFTNYFCYEIPSHLNASRGDVILSQGQSLIRDLVESIGQSFSHSAMALSASSIRHAEMYTDEGSLNHEGGLVPDRLKPTGSRSLRDGHPGIITETIATALAGNALRVQNGWILTGPSSSLRLGAASFMESFNGHYRLFAYTDMFWSNPFQKTPDEGTMCSGAIAVANAAHSTFGWTAFPYDAEVRREAAQVLYDRVRDSVIDGVPGYVNFIGAISLITRLALIRPIKEAATRIANQVVNCMTMNDCGNTGDRWRNGVGTGTTISPENLAVLAALHNILAQQNGTPNQFVYQSSKPVSVSDTYFCCMQENPAARPSPAGTDTMFPCHFTPAGR